MDEREGKEVSSHELRYVHTVCTVIEERFISSEMVEDGIVVPGSDKFWPVREFQILQKNVAYIHTYIYSTYYMSQSVIWRNISCENKA